MAEYSWLIDDIETLSTYTKDGYTRAVLNQAVKAIRKLSADVAPGCEFRDCRNELCFRCGKYRTAHLGSCDGCRWRH